MCKLTLTSGFLAPSFNSNLLDWAFWSWFSINTDLSSGRQLAACVPMLIRLVIFFVLFFEYGELVMSELWVAALFWSI